MLLSEAHAGLRDCLLVPPQRRDVGHVDTHGAASPQAAGGTLQHRPPPIGLSARSATPGLGNRRPSCDVTQPARRAKEPTRWPPAPRKRGQPESGAGTLRAQQRGCAACGAGARAG
eukprot:10553897-Alexandrium_andersonii.AAC.1